MKRKNATRSALFTSIISLLLCVSMLVGATFAWFTDNVQSGMNTIAAGNLDVELYHSDKNDSGYVDVNTLLFNDVALWEPGVVAYENFVVENKGNLALKYQLSINFENETVVNGHGLSEALQVAVVDGGFNGGREDAQTLTNLVPLKSFVESGVLEGDTKSETYGIVIYWQPGDDAVDNLFNMKNVEKNADGSAVEPLTIDLGVNLFATQEMYEEDSFGPDYDENAPYSVWDGTVPTEMPETLVVDGDTQTVHVKDAAAFAYLSTLSAKWAEFYTDGKGTTYTNYANGAGEKYYYSDQWTISLEADIDLGNYAIAPVDIVIGEATGATAFSGNNHVIRNINTTTGLFADKAHASFSDLTLVNVKATNGALAGSADNDISNVTVKNATISGAEYVGGVVGYTYGAVNGCKVIDSSVAATGKEAGGLAGYVVTSRAEATVANNTVRNVSVYAGNRAAGLVAQVNVNVKVYNNTVDTVTVGAEDTSTYAAGAVVSNALAPENVYDNTVVNANVLGIVDVVNKPEELNDAINNAQSGTIIILGGGEYSLPSLANKEGITIDGGDGAVIGGENASTGFGGNFGKNTTIKNVTFAGSSNGARGTYANGGTSTFENCTFAGDSTYGFHIDESNGATFIFNNCTFSGFNAFAGDLVKVVFNNCTFLHNGNYGHTNIWSVAEFNNCTFGDKASVSPAGSGKLYFDGVEESYHHEFIGSAESLVAFADSVNNGGDNWNGQKVVLVADIDLEGKAWTPIGQTSATQFNGMFDGQNHTIKNLSIDSSAQTGEYYATGLFGWLFNASVENVKVDTATVVGGAYVGVIAGYLEWEGTTVENCHVTNAIIEGKHVSDTRCGDKVGVIVGYAGNPGTPVKNCSATNCTVTAGRDAGQIVGAAKAANVIDCTATNVTVAAAGECTGANINNAIIGRNLG